MTQRDTFAENWHVHLGRGPEAIGEKNSEGIPPEVLSSVGRPSRRLGALRPTMETSMMLPMEPVEAARRARALSWQFNRVCITSDSQYGGVVSWPAAVSAVLYG